MGNDVVYGPAAPVPVFQHEAEFTSLLDLYRERKPMRVLEIGSYHGGTLFHWLKDAQPGALVVSVDTYTAADNRGLYPEWTPADVRLEVIQGDSRDPRTVAQVRKFAPFEFTFIDAGHLYPEVADDWRNYGPMTEGVVAFHDILDDPKNHPEIEVARLWEEIKREHSTREIVQDREAWWGGIGIVFK